MKKLYTLLILSIVALTMTAQEWNISSDDFNALGKLEATVTVNGLTIHASEAKPITIDTNGKELDGYTFTHRLKFGGGGSFDGNTNPVGRVVSFPVSGDTKITVMAISSSGSTDRELVIAVDSMNNELGRMPAPGSPITKGEFDYVGGEATIFIFSPSSGVNLYLIKAETATNMKDISSDLSVAKTEFYNLNGQQIKDKELHLRTGIFIQRTTYNDGSVDSKKITLMQR